MNQSVNQGENPRTPPPVVKTVTKGELWKMILSGIVGAIATLAVGWIFGLFGRAGTAAVSSGASAILGHLELSFNDGGKNGTIPGNYIAECKSPEDLLIGGSCSLQSRSEAVLQNFGIDKKSKTFGCVYAGREYDTATISVVAACLHVKQ